MDSIKVIRKLLVFDNSHLKIYIDNDNRILVPYNTIEYFLCYETGSFSNKLRSKKINNFLIAYDVTLVNIDAVNVSDKSRAMYINDMFDLIRYDMDRMNKNKKECKLLTRITDNYILYIKNSMEI